jgi:hypothetical protein
MSDEPTSHDSKTIVSIRFVLSIAVLVLVLVLVIESDRGAIDSSHVDQIG